METVKAAEKELLQAIDEHIARKMLRCDDPEKFKELRLKHIAMRDFVRLLTEVLDERRK